MVLIISSSLLNDLVVAYFHDKINWIIWWNSHHCKLLHFLLHISYTIIQTNHLEAISILPTGIPISRCLYG